MCGKEVGLGLFPFDSLESQSYDFGEIARIKLVYGAERLHTSSFKSCRVFEKIEKSQKTAVFWSVSD